VVWLRGMARRRGLLGASVALAFLLSSGILGFELATAPPSPPSHPAGAADDPAARSPAGPVVPDAPATQAPPAAAAPSPAPAAPPPDTAVPDATPQAVLDQFRHGGFAATVRAEERAGDCVANSYGQTQVFLRGHRCLGMSRALLDVRGADGGEALVAVSRVRMPDGTGAAALRRVLDRPGSGNLDALDPSVPFTGQYYASRVDADSAVNADAHPVSPGLSPADLHSIVATAIG
jgi:hypothetical protein